MATRRRTRLLAVLGAVALVAAGLVVGLGILRRIRDRLLVPPRDRTRVEEHALHVDGRDRTYELHVPDPLPGGPRPLVLVLHGGKGDAELTAAQTGFDDESQARGFLAAYPEGVDGTWNAGSCCGVAEREDVDDVAFLRAVIDDVASRRAVDRARVFVTGMSNGGMMAYRFACEASEEVAAIAPVEATMLTPCSPTVPVSVHHVHGTDDRNVLLEGGRNEHGFVRQDRPPVRDGLENFAVADGCDGAPELVVGGTVDLERWTGCGSGTAVELVTIEGGGHAWPGGARLRFFLDEPSDAYDATPAIWAFFVAHPRGGTG